MDLRHSSSTAASNAGRDSLLSEDDNILTVTSALAKDAMLYFQSRKFAECIKILNQLNQMKENDPKVLHNIAIAEFYKDGCSDPKQLIEALQHVQKLNEDWASVTREQACRTAEQSSYTACNDRSDNALAILNVAVAWFHLHEYTKVLSILEPLFQNIEPLDETIALQICFLLLDVVLVCRDAAKFVDVLNYMEKTYGAGSGNNGENGNTMQLSTNQVSKTSSLPTSSSASDTANSDLAAVESTLSRSLSEETLEYDNVFAEIKEQNMTKRAEHFPPSNLVVKSIGGRSISTVDLKLELLLYKVRFLILTRNLKLAKREVKHAIDIARGSDSSVALFLKAQLEYSHGNSQKAIKLLMASGVQTDAGSSSMFSSNLGCIHYQLGKYHTSCALFSKALNSYSSLRKENPVKLLSLSQDKSLLVTYNCGVLFLTQGKPLIAFKCFQKAAKVFYKQPLLWLRVAECCLMASLKGLLKERKTSAENPEIIIRVVGKGKWRHLLIEENGSAEISSTTQCSKLSLPLARVCLTNTLHLLNESDSNDSKSDLHAVSSSVMNESTEAPTSYAMNVSSDTKGGMSQDMIQNSLLFYKDVQTKENHMIRQAVHANMAYVELESENPVKALSAAKTLLEIPDCSKFYVFLGHIYAAEALCLLNRTKEAGKHLYVYMVGDNGFEIPYSKEDSENWGMNKKSDCEEQKNSSMGETRETVFFDKEEAHGTLYANLAALLATQGNLDEAQRMVTQALSILPDNVQATLTATYIDLKLGNSKEAVERLKKCKRVSFLPGVLSPS